MNNVLRSADCASPRKMKLLAVGHSNCRLSAMELCPIFHNLNYEDLTLGVIYRGDSDFAIHEHFATTNEAGVVYHRPTVEKFCDPEELNHLVDYASILDDQPWDTVVLYQGGGSYKEEAQFGETLNNLLDVIQKHCPNAKFFYGPHCAYPVTSTTPSFGKYDFDQQAMHEASLDSVRKFIWPNKRFSGIIPVTTLLQSLRTKYGEAFHVEDKVHMNINGVFAVGMLWYAVLTGLPLDGLTYLPEGASPEIAADAKAIIPRLLEDPFTLIDLSK
ncbi:MAG: DUF4886 domain-containing protein [Clostridia bacterium]|nr:DUF4886 domain-containing protein [Clostridia bacterium]